MSQLAPMLGKLKESGAERVLFAPGELAYAWTGETRRPLAGSPTSASVIAEAIAEVLSHDEIRDLPSTRPRIVRHEHAGDEFVLEVTRQSSGIALGIRLAGKRKESVREAPRDSFRESLKDSVRGEASRERRDHASDEPMPTPTKSLPREREPPATTAAAGATAPKASPPKSRPTNRRFRVPGARTDKRTIRVELDDEGNPADSTALDLELEIKMPPPKAQPDAPFDRFETKPVIRPTVDGAPLRAGHVEDLLRANDRASDVHLACGSPPAYRTDRVLRFDESRAPLAAADVEALVFPTMPDGVRRDFEKRREVEYACELAGVGRLRVSVFEDQAGTRAIFHRLPKAIATAHDLGLPRACLELAKLSRGLVVLTGAPGAGTSSTLAAMIDLVSRSRDGHLVTIEDPIEVLHPRARCLVSQREVGRHTKTAASGLRAAVREDPDVIAAGELRDAETTVLALEAAASRLVFATLRSPSAVSAVERLIERAPSVRAMLAESLAAVVAQTLRPRPGGKLVGVFETLLGTPEVSALIHEGKTSALVSIMEASRDAGMITMDEALRALGAG